MIRFISDIKPSGVVCYYVIENTTSGMVLGAYLGTTVEEALDLRAEGEDPKLLEEDQEEEESN